MLWTVLSTVASLALAGAAGGGLIYAVRQVRSLKKSRMAQMIVQLCEYWDSPPMMEARKFIHQQLSGYPATADWAKEMARLYDNIYRDPNRFDEFLMLGRVLNFIHNIAVFSQKGLLDIELIDSVFGHVIENYCEIFKDIISGYPQGKPIQELIENLRAMKEDKSQRKRLPTTTSE